MLTSGAQIRAARALLGWQIVDLAKATHLHRNSIAYWERPTVIDETSEPVGVSRIRAAFERWATYDRAIDELQAREDDLAAHAILRLFRAAGR